MAKVKVFVHAANADADTDGRAMTSDVKPKLKIPMGTAVFAQNFPGLSDKSEYEEILYVLTPLDMSRDSIYRTVRKSFRHFSADSKLTYYLCNFSAVTLST